MGKIIVTGSATGMCIGERLGLKWEDLNFESRTISVNHNLSVELPVFVEYKDN